MAKAIHRKYLSVSQDLEARIRKGGRDHERFPSVREIAEEFGISVSTALRALQVLRDKGLIQTVERSGNFISEASTAHTDAYAVCLHLTPGPWQRTAGNLSMAGFQSLHRQTGIPFVANAFDLREGIALKEIDRQVRLALDAGICGVFLLPSRVSDAAAQLDEMLLKACRAQKLPVVLIERNLRGHLRPREFDLVANDDFDGGARCTQHLLQNGCRRIVFVTGSPTSSHDQRIGGYFFALHLAGANHDLAPTVLQEPIGCPSRQAYRQLTDQILRCEADGIICYQDYLAIGLIMELAMRGIKIPKKVRLVGFDDLPIGDTLAIGVTSYAFPTLDLARHALRLMRDRRAHPESPPVELVLAGNLIIRESSSHPGA